MSPSAKAKGSANIKCPACGCDSLVVETRRTSYGTRRRRRCETPGVSCRDFTTAEMLVPWPDHHTATDIAIVRLEDLATLKGLIANMLGEGGASERLALVLERWSAG